MSYANFTALRMLGWEAANDRPPRDESGATKPVQQNQRLCMKAEDWRMHMRSIRCMATRAELYGNRKDAEVLRGLADQIERDLHGLESTQTPPSVIPSRRR
jgi:hypothetical protein